MTLTEAGVTEATKIHMMVKKGEGVAATTTNSTSPSPASSSKTPAPLPPLDFFVQLDAFLSKHLTQEQTNKVVNEFRKVLLHGMGSTCFSNLFSVQNVKCCSKPVFFFNSEKHLSGNGMYTGSSDLFSVTFFYISYYSSCKSSDVIAIVLYFLINHFVLSKRQICMQLNPSGTRNDDRQFFTLTQNRRE